jgi:sulfur carrier protein
LITIQLNGEPCTIEAGAEIEALLKKLDLRVSRVGIEVNQVVVPKADYRRTLLKDGDRVEIVHFVGGG